MATIIGNNLPPLPPGFVLGDAPQQAQPTAPEGLPPLPSGFVIGDAPQQPQQAAPAETQTLAERIAGALGVGEVAATIGSSALAEPIAGLAGIAQGLNPFAEEGAAAEAVSGVREALTFQPRTEAGKESLQAVGEFLEPVGKVLTAAEEKLGGAVFEVTGSPVLAAGAASLPTAVLESLGLKGGRLFKSTKNIQPSQSAIKASLKEAAPAPEVLLDLGRDIYKELDNSGVKIKTKSFNKLTKKIAEVADKQGLSDLTTPRAFGVLKKIQDDAGKPIPVSRIQEQIRIAKKIGTLPDAAEASAANAIADVLIDELNDLTPAKVIKGNIPAAEIGTKLKAANNLWSRGSKGELLKETIEKAKNTASGFENGLRIEFDKITKNKKLRKFFKTSELDAMNDLVRGDRAQNFAKLIGRFGFSEGRATNTLLSVLGGGAGAFAGGIGGAFVIPSIGQASKVIAQRLTKNKASFIEAITRAGDNGKDITKAYLKVTPKSKRSVAELSSLLSDPNINLENLIGASDKLIKEATEIAAGRQVLGELAGVGGAGAASGAARE